MQASGTKGIKSIFSSGAIHDSSKASSSLLRPKPDRRLKRTQAHRAVCSNESQRAEAVGNSIIASGPKNSGSLLPDIPLTLKGYWQYISILRQEFMYLSKLRRSRDANGHPGEVSNPECCNLNRATDQVDEKGDGDCGKLVTGSSSPPLCHWNRTE